MSTTPSPFTRETFRKSSYSRPDRDCVEVARDTDGVEVRDSKTAFGSSVDAHLAFTQRQFAAFLSVVRKGDINS